MNRSLPSLADTHFDLLICGGSIYGAWTAYDAAQRSEHRMRAQIGMMPTHG